MCVFIVKLKNLDLKDKISLGFIIMYNIINNIFIHHNQLHNT